MDLDVAYNVYRKCKENGIPLTPNLYTNLLSLTAGLGDPGCGSLMRRTAPPKDYHKAMEIYTSIRQLNIIPAEAAFSALMRCCCSEGHKEQALELYEDMKRLGLEPKLRGVTALVAAYGAAGDTSTCFYLFDEMKTKLNIDPTEKEYYSLLQACAIAKDARFISVVDELMEDHLLLHDQETIDLIYQHLHEQYHFGQASSIVEASGALKDVTTDVASPLVLQSIDLNVQTRSGLLEQLQSFAIDRDPNQKHKLNNKVKDLVSLKPAAAAAVAAADAAPPSVATAADTAMVTVEEGTVKDATNKNKDTTRKYVVLPKANEEKWTAFTSWLDKRYEAYPFDILVDGANVGYYKQNFPGAPNHIDYHQLHALIEALIRDHGRKPLLIIHSRHLADHMIPPQDPKVRSLIASWRERNIVYATPKGFNDDWFWLYTTVRFQIPVVTNDEMRDHHFKLLSPRYFMRWRERYRVCYDLFFARNDLRQQQQHADEDDDDSEEYDSEDDGEGEEEGDGGGGGGGQPDTAAASQAQGATATTATTDNGFSFRSNQVSKFSSACHRSRARFFFPRKYSYRMQHIVREDVEAFCFPPLAPRYDNNLVDPEQGRQPKSDAEGGGGGSDKDRSDGHHVKIDDRKPWVCLYRRK